MAAPKLRRWVCPQCGDGVHAPSRPRMDDVRRYCLICSKKTGRLVQRTSPSLDRERQASKLKSQEKAGAKRTRVRQTEQAKWIRAGIDVRKEMKRLLAFPALADEPYARQTGWNLRHLTINGSLKEYATGHAYYEGGPIHLTLPENSTLGAVRAVLTHELAHAVMPRDVHHGDRWARCFARIVREAYGVSFSVRASDKYKIQAAAIAALNEESHA